MPTFIFFALAAMLARPRVVVESVYGKRLAKWFEFFLKPICRILFVIQQAAQQISERVGYDVDITRHCECFMESVITHSRMLWIQIYGDVITIYHISDCVPPLEWPRRE